jgi:quercetin dioxygenase-like cupin family protein
LVGHLNLFPVRKVHHKCKAHAPGTKELIQVREGTLTVEAGGEQFTLQAGDAVAFSGDVAHGYGNPGSTPARFSLAVFEPGVGHGSTQEHGGA